MLDVFVAAILIITVGPGAIADDGVHFGVYASAASVFPTMTATSKIVKLTNPAILMYENPVV